jgi:hypothetical protein
MSTNAYSNGPVNYPGLQGNNITLGSAPLTSNSTVVFSQRAASAFWLPTAGGLALPRAYSIHSLSANAIGIVSPTYGNAYVIDGRWPVYPTLYTINYAYVDPGLVNFGGQTEDTNGIAWLLLPDGVTTLLSPRAPSLVFCSTASTDNGKYTPIISANGIPLDPNTVNPGAAFCVGQYVTFSNSFPQALPADVVILSNNWSFSGRFLNASNLMDPSKNFPYCSWDYFVSSNLLKNAATTAWWKSGGDGSTNANAPASYCQVLWIGYILLDKL